jgi:ATP-binding cassette subfamily B protein
MPTEFEYVEEDALGKSYDLKLLRRLYPFAGPYRRLLAVSIVLVVLITLLDLAVPYIIKIAIDRYIVPGQMTRNENESRTGAAHVAGGRYYEIRIDTPAVRKIVSEHPDLFEIKDGTARISLADLASLNREDILRLRQKDLSGIGRMAAIFLLLVVLDFLLNFVQVILMEYAGQRVMHDLRIVLFRHIQSRSVSFFNKNPVGRLVTRVTNDVQNMYELFTSVISFVFKDLFLLVGIAAVLVGISWKLALVSFTVLPIVLLASFSFSGRARTVFREQRIKIAEINTRISETISGMKVIQLFRQERQNYRRFERLNHENYLAAMRQILLFGTFMPFIEFMGVFALAIIIFYGGKGVMAESISLGAVVAFLSYMRMFFRPIRDIAEKYNILQNAMASAERIFLILDNREALPQRIAAPVGTPARLDRIEEVALEKVFFEYVPGEPVLKDITFRFQARQTLAVVGPTGSGKTTLINLITRFYDATSGRVLINGQDIRSLDPAVLRSKIALVMQDPFLFSGTLRENIVRGDGSISEAKLEEIVQASNCRSIVEKHADGLDSRLPEGGSNLSSGERQLVSIARAMARNPELIILDEATSYIDSTTEQQIQKALDNLLVDRTAVVIAHRLSTARNADKIMVLNRGRILEAGTHRELMESRGFYYRLTQL